ncbi:MAG TPA: hydantoinase/oxoprolinase N-terminal domain-containing protein, partial [Candidatus Bathyarchaeia archaeon]|nr:hydantoinase/oxoprolinase N-terminal domain-containing protein [Candidatus Bathyarchaeia archaeon]
MGIDIGGTFTDVVGFDDSHPNNVQVVKVPTNTKHPEKSAVEALHNYRELASQVSLVAHATTVATNALLTHTGLAKTA